MSRSSSGIACRLASTALLLSLLVGCASAPDRRGIEPSFAVEPARDSLLGQAARPHIETQTDQSLSGVYLLGNSAEALASRLMMINSAEKSLDLQTYIYRKDGSGTLTTSALRRAADKGVRIRLLLDDLEAPRQAYPLQTLDAHPNIEVRLYNPFYAGGGRWLQFIMDYDRLNHRMHNKAMIADNMLAIVGGRNIGDEYFDANQGGNFGDLDVLLAGPAVSEVSHSFDRYWNAAVTYPLNRLTPTAASGTPAAQRRNPDNSTHSSSPQDSISRDTSLLHNADYRQALRDTQILERMQTRQLPWIWAPVQVWSDPPVFSSLQTTDVTTHPASKNPAGLNEAPTGVLEHLRTLFLNAEEELLLVSPYFIPLEEGMQLLAAKAAAGVNIHLITNSLAATDAVATHGAYADYRRPLLTHDGIAIFEVKAAPELDPKSWSLSSTSGLHAKTFIVDKRWVFIGSFNLDPRSARLNTELGVLIDSPALAQRMEKQIREQLGDIAYQVKIEDGDLQWTDLQTGEQYRSDPDASLWRHFLSNFFSLLPIDEQL